MTPPRILGVVLVGVSAMGCGPADAPDPVPASLATTSRIVIATEGCGQRDATRISIADPVQVRSLVAEVTSFRQAPAKVQAAIFSCATVLDFFAQDQKLTRIFVLTCSAFESAPVTGRRYFTFKGGMNKLPALSGLLGLPAQAACHDA